MAAAWSAIDAPVLVLHGQFDENTNQADHVRIAEVVGAKHSGRAEARALSGLDHCWTQHAAMVESRDHYGAASWPEPAVTCRRAGGGGNGVGRSTTGVNWDVELERLVPTD